MKRYPGTCTSDSEIAFMIFTNSNFLLAQTQSQLLAMDQYTSYIHVLYIHVHHIYDYSCSTYIHSSFTRLQVYLPLNA